MGSQIRSHRRRAPAKPNNKAPSNHEQERRPRPSRPRLPRAGLGGSPLLLSTQRGGKAREGRTSAEAETERARHEGKAREARIEFPKGPDEDAPVQARRRSYLRPRRRGPLQQAQESERRDPSGSRRRPGRLRGQVPAVHEGGKGAGFTRRLYLRPVRAQRRG